uniref:Uncharacterized protein n=1 Tax=Anguilla anguilla TaxID=7936 RepID=A0A0E9QFF3_ANGAN
MARAAKRSRNGCHRLQASVNGCTVTGPPSLNLIRTNDD